MYKNNSVSLHTALLPANSVMVCLQVFSQVFCNLCGSMYAFPCHSPSFGDLLTIRIHIYYMVSMESSFHHLHYVSEFQYVYT